MEITDSDRYRVSQFANAELQMRYACFEAPYENLGERGGARAPHRIDRIAV